MFLNVFWNLRNEEKISKTLIYLNFLPYFSIFSRAREIQYCTTKIFYKIIYSIDQKNSFELLCNCRKCLHTFTYVLKFKITSTIDQKPFGFCTSAKIYVYVDSIQFDCIARKINCLWLLYINIFSQKNPKYVCRYLTLNFFSSQTHVYIHSPLLIIT